MTADEIVVNLNDDLHFSMWIDGLQRPVKFRESSIEEIGWWIQTLQTQPMRNGHQKNAIHAVTSLFDSIIAIYSLEATNIYMDEDGLEFLSYSKEFFMVKADNCHLPSTHFILHVLLSMGCFNTEIGLTKHSSLKGALCQTNCSFQ
eukprot:15366089-Ditylum_brightwellii.AAC.2